MWITIRRAESTAFGCLLALFSCSSGASPDVCQVPPGKIAVLIRLDGRELPEGEFIAPTVKDDEPPYQGVQLDVLPPGYHPQVRSNHYRWELFPQVVVPSDSVGVMVRLFGESLPEGQIFADENPDDEKKGILRKGILAKTLGPGTHFINLRAFDVIVAPRVSLGPGQVGIVTRLYGNQPADPNAFIVGPNERGVQSAPLPPGAHYINPYTDLVMPMSRESQRIDLKAPGRRVRSPTLDGFDVALNGTIEWAVPEEAAPLAFARYGNIDKIQDTLLMPATRAVSREQGLRTAVRDFLSSARLLAFQNNTEADLKALVEKEGIEVQDLTVSGVEPPSALAEVIQFREASSLTREQYLAEIEKAKSTFDVLRAQVGEERPEALAKEKKSSLEKTGLVAKQKSEIENYQNAIRERVATDKQRAEVDAAEIRRKAEIEAASIRRASDLEVAALKPLIDAHGGGVAYARSLAIERMVPRLQSVSADIDGPLGAMLRNLATDPSANPSPAPKKEEKQQ